MNLEKTTSSVFSQSKITRFKFPQTGICLTMAGNGHNLDEFCPFPGAKTEVLEKK